MAITNSCLPVVVIGGGPAGLMAADVLLQAGVPVSVYEAMPSLGRKFLRAGVGGLNLTHSEHIDQFVSRYQPRQTPAEWVRHFGPDQVCSWANNLGVQTFTGSSGRVFPVHKKASPLLRAWLSSLQQQGAQLFVRYRWLGWQSYSDDGGQVCQRHRFMTPEGELIVNSQATVLALGGGSWAKLGSDGKWRGLLSSMGVNCQPFLPSNCGFNVVWSDYLRQQFAGSPLKSVALRMAGREGHDVFQRRGEAVVTATGIEGGLIYAASGLIRETVQRDGSALLYWDLLPDHSEQTILARLQMPRGKESRSNFLRKRLGLGGIKLAMIHELTPDAMESSQTLAESIKSLPMTVTAARPLDEAISTAGGVALNEVTDNLMLKKFPGVFCAGEMLDWDAPTGGYLLTASFASGRIAGHSVDRYLLKKTS